MKKIILILFAAFIQLSAYAQLNVEITTDKIPLYSEDGDTISVCRDTLIIFKAEVTLSGNPVENASYKWIFDDGNNEEGENLDSLSHLFTNGGGYRVKLEVTDQAVNTGYDIQTVKIAHQAVFEGTNNGLGEDQTSICKGSFSTLTGIAHPYLWKDEVTYNVINILPIEVNNASPYSSVFTFDEFEKDDVFSEGDIDSISVNLEHSDMGQIQVSITCPNGTSAVIKDFSATNHSDLGEPIQDPDAGEGTGHTYYWSPSSTNGYMNDASDDPIPHSDDYEPFENLSTLNGCPMNGDWTIIITDNTDGDNGFIFSQEIIFSEEALPPVWAYSDTLKKAFTLWTGSGNPVTQVQEIEEGGIKGIALATPEIYGNNPYKYSLRNDWGCPVDTTIGLTTERPVFTVTPEAGEAELDVSLTSSTNWAVRNDWSLGDKTPDLTGEKVEHTYMEKGTYEIILTAEDEHGCTDTDTTVLEVSVEPSELTVPNFFSPDDNGINDILTIQIEGMEKFNFTIYSRWGRNVFSTTDEETAKTGWDGRVGLTNLKASPGIYFYIFKGVGKDEKEWEEKGAIQIAR